MVVQESKTRRTSIFWNVWTLLAMPAIWLAWSLISFIVCMISFVWRTGTPQDMDKRLSRDQALIPRIVVSCVFAFGLVYFILIVFTLRRYGSMMDLTWQARIKDRIDEALSSGPTYHRGSQSHSRGSSHPDIYPLSTAYPPSVVYAPYAPTPFPPPPSIPYSWPSYPNYSSSPPVVLVHRPVPVQPTVVPIPVLPPTIAHPLNSSDSGTNDQAQIREGPFTRGSRPESSSRPLSVSRDKRITKPEVTKIRMTKLVDLSPDKEVNFYSPTDEDLASCQVSREKWVEMNEVGPHSNCFFFVHPETSATRISSNLGILIN